MVDTVLITGSTSAVQEVADAVTAAGATPVITTAKELDSALAGIGDGELKHYIQLPISVDHTGGTVTSRIRNFLSEGLLTRYRAAEKVLPKLSSDANVVIVAGNVNTESAAPDDRSARLSLVYVLAHALRTDKGSDDFTVTVARPGTDIERIVDSALTGATVDPSADQAPGAAVDPGLDYDEWRVEMLGGMRSEF